MFADLYVECDVCYRRESDHSRGEYVFLPFFSFVSLYFTLKIYEPILLYLRDKKSKLDYLIVRSLFDFWVSSLKYGVENVYHFAVISPFDSRDYHFRYTVRNLSRGSFSKYTAKSMRNSTSVCVKYNACVCSKCFFKRKLRIRSALIKAMDNFQRPNICTHSLTLQLHFVKISHLPWFRTTCAYFFKYVKQVNVTISKSVREMEF